MNVREVAVNNAHNHQLMVPDPMQTDRPLLRVYLLGSFRLEWQIPPLTQKALWSGRTSARTLFLLLLLAVSAD